MLICYINFNGLLVKPLVLIIVMLLSVGLGSKIVGIVLKNAFQVNNDSEKNNSHIRTDATENLESTNRSVDQNLQISIQSSGGDASHDSYTVLNGGVWIGRLERFAVTTLILVRMPELITLVVTLKVASRYGALQTHSPLSEEFLIGSGTSLIWASIWGVVGLAVLGLL